MSWQLGASPNTQSWEMQNPEIASVSGSTRPTLLGVSLPGLPSLPALSPLLALMALRPPLSGLDPRETTLVISVPFTAPGERYHPCQASQHSFVPPSHRPHLAPLSGKGPQTPISSLFCHRARLIFPSWTGVGGWGRSSSLLKKLLQVLPVRHCRKSKFLVLTFKHLIIEPHQPFQPAFLSTVRHHDSSSSYPWAFAQAVLSTGTPHISKSHYCVSTPIP